MMMEEKQNARRACFPSVIRAATEKALLPEQQRHERPLKTRGKWLFSDSFQHVNKLPFGNNLNIVSSFIQFFDFQEFFPFFGVRI